MIGLVPDQGELIDRGLRALGVARRRHDLLRHLMASAADEVTTAELMAATGASHTTVRHHLEALTKAGYVTQRHSPQPSGGGLVVYWMPDRAGIAAAISAAAESASGR